MVDNSHLVSILTNHSPHFKELWIKHQSRLVSLIQQFLSQQRKHNDISEWKHLETQYMGSVELKKRFGGSGGYYKKVIEPYFDCVDKTYKKGNGGFTKKWTLKKWLVDEIQTYLLKDNQPITISVISDDERELVELNEISVNGVDCDNTNLYLPSSLDVNTNLLDEYIEKVEYHHTYRNENKQKVLFQLLSIKKHLNNTQCPNQLLQFYQQSCNGRFNQKGGMGIIHPIQFPKEIRNIIFGGMDLNYFDISNSHLSIMYHLGKELGCSGLGIKTYLDNKVEIRNGWEEESGYSIKSDVIKKYIISWIYGNSNNVGDFNSFDKVLGYDRMLKIKYNDDVLGGLYKDIKEIKNVIVDNTEINNGCYMNVWGKGLPTFLNGKKTPKKRILPHILFGWESKIMETINVKMDSGMKVLIYDGYIGTENDTDKMNRVVVDNLGLDIKFDTENITPPLFINSFV